MRLELRGSNLDVVVVRECAAAKWRSPTEYQVSRHARATDLTTAVTLGRDDRR